MAGEAKRAENARPPPLNARDWGLPRRSACSVARPLGPPGTGTGTTRNGQGDHQARRLRARPRCSCGNRVAQPRGCRRGTATGTGLPVAAAAAGGHPGAGRGLSRQTGAGSGGRTGAALRAGSGRWLCPPPGRRWGGPGAGGTPAPRAGEGRGQPPGAPPWEGRASAVTQTCRSRGGRSDVCTGSAPQAGRPVRSFQSAVGGGFNRK